MPTAAERLVEASCGVHQPEYNLDCIHCRTNYYINLISEEYTSNWRIESDRRTYLADLWHLRSRVAELEEIITRNGLTFPEDRRTINV